MWKRIGSVLLFILILIGCSNRYMAGSKTIRIKGSDTMRILAERWAEEYMKIRPNIAVYAEGGGTVTGIRALITGDVDICAASRPLKADEVQQLAQKYDRLGVATLVAKDALSVYVNADNPVQDLSMIRLKQIFAGEIRTWDQLGGTPDSIIVLIRSPNSGTYLYFQEHVLRDENYSSHAQTLPSTMSIIRAVADDQHAIGYGGIAYDDPGIVHCRINSVAPSEDTVRDDTYPITRYLYFYTIDTPRGTPRRFIDWVLNDGQRIVREVGYIPLWDVR
ncbi:phosphate ABC transporter substrate-binding protein [candidate division KSB1 bacterium]|nr:phosphate ABC transporter substrate-binding protein [candidate division KSB1 bacterium]